MRKALLVISILLCSITPAAAQVSLGIGVPGVQVAISIPVYPRLVLVPSYPVYYAPDVDSNYFFYDGMYWIYTGDNWYTSAWYNGPWALVTPDAVPLFILRVPVRYYRRPPVYFQGWASDAPPRWGEHWGGSWEQSHGGWDQWNRASVPAPAPLPTYQRQYSGNRYPSVQQQQALQTQNYHYQPHEASVQRNREQQGKTQAAAPAQTNRGTPQARTATQTRERTAGSPPSSERTASTASSTQQHAATPREESAAQKPSQESKRSTTGAPAAQRHEVASSERQPAHPTVATHAQPTATPQAEHKAPQNKVQEPRQEPRQAKVQEPRQQPSKVQEPKQSAAPQRQPQVVAQHEATPSREQREPQGKAPAQEKPKQGEEEKH